MEPFHVIKIVNEPDDQMLELLQENVIGTPGESMVYRHHNVPAKVRAVPNPYFANLSIRNRLYGTICLSKRDVYNSGVPHEAFYLRYFTFREGFRTTKQKNHGKRNSSLVREDVTRLMNGRGLDYNGNLLLYAYVDPANMRSKRLIDEFGFEKISDFKVIPFSRLMPRNSKKLVVADESMFSEIKKTLLATYREEQLVSFENLFRQGEYFLIKEKGEFVCGVQAIPDQWEIQELPGFVGKILLKLVPRIPFLNRLFNPHFKFTFLEFIFCLPGHEHQLETLFESVLFHYRLNSAILCLDEKSRIYSMVKRNNMGLTHKLQGEKKIDVVVKTTNAHVLSSNIPTSVSGYDVL